MDIISEVARIVAPVFLLAAVGVGWTRLGWAFDMRFVTRLAMSVSLPCLVFTALVESEVEPGVLASTLLAALGSYFGVGIIGYGVVRATRLDLPTFWAPFAFGNTGNLGLPIAFFAFGQNGFDVAVVVFAVMAILSFTVGVWVVSGGGSPLRAVQEPLVWGTVAGAVFLLAGWDLPDWAGNTLDLLGQIAIPVMLITLGVAISRLAPRSIGRAVWFSLVKLGVCIAVPLGIGVSLGLPRTALGVLILQLATPVAVTSYMLAVKYEAQADEVAGLVVVSTLIGVVALPGLLAFFV